jgi:hypothetical protein
MLASDFPHRMQAAQAELVASSRRGVRAGAVVMTGAVRGSILGSTRGGVLRGVGRSGAKVGARYVVLGNRPAALVRATGPLHLLERDTKAHQMPKAGGARAKPYRTPYGPRRRVNHPGSKGKHPFEKGIAASIDPARRAMAAEVTAGVTRSLRA